jgi:hypothetical protein
MAAPITTILHGDSDLKKKFPKARENLRMGLQPDDKNRVKLAFMFFYRKQHWLGLITKWSMLFDLRSTCLY